MNDPKVTPIPPASTDPVRTVTAAAGGTRQPQPMPPLPPQSPVSAQPPGGSPPAREAVASSAAEVAQEAKGQASQVAQVAGQEVQTAWHGLREDLRSQAAQQTDRAGAGLRQLNEQLQALRRGDVEAAGPVAGYADQLQSRVQQLAQRVEQGGFDGMVRDVRDIARRRPVAFLAGAAAAGFFAGRLLRSSTANSNNGNGQGNGRGQGNGYGYGAQTTAPRPVSGTVPPAPPVGTIPAGGPAAPVTPSGLGDGPRPGGIGS